MLGASDRLQRYADRLASGLLAVPEVASAVLDLLAGSADPSNLWAGAPAALRGPVLAYLAGVGLDGLPAVFYIGPSDPAWRAAQAARRRRVAAELLAAAGPAVAPDGAGSYGN